MLAPELRLAPDFDVVAPIRTRNDEEWIAGATFARQLFNGERPRHNPATVRSRRQNDRTDFKLAACQPGNSAPLIQGTLGDIVALSLGGGQGNGTTDPSARSDLKGREVGTRSAEPPRHPLSLLRGQA